MCVCVVITVAHSCTKCIGPSHEEVCVATGNWQVVGGEIELSKVHIAESVMDDGM